MKDLLDQNQARIRDLIWLKIRFFSPIIPVATNKEGEGEEEEEEENFWLEILER